MQSCLILKNGVVVRVPSALTLNNLAYYPERVYPVPYNSQNKQLLIPQRALTNLNFFFYQVIVRSLLDLYQIKAYTAYSARLLVCLSSIRLSCLGKN
jgi:hypothetical protein